MSIQSIGGLLQIFLAQDYTIESLVAGRIYPVRLPQKAVMPALTYQQISGVRIGQLNGPASAADPRYQVDAWAGSWNAAWELGNAVRQRLEGFTGFWDDTQSPSGIHVRVAVRFDSDLDLFEEIFSEIGGVSRVGHEWTPSF